VRVLIIDCEGTALDLALRTRTAGHQVRWWVRPRRDGQRRCCGDGIIERIGDFVEVQRKWLDWADLVIETDNVAYTEMLDQYRARGYPIFGPSHEAAQLEIDRASGQRALRAAGIPILPAQEFHDYDAALDYVRAHVKKGRGFVSKPSGNSRVSEDKSNSYVSDDAGDMQYMLQRWKENPKYRASARDGGFILQDKVSGCEMAVGGWYVHPTGWVGPWCENWEYKKLMDGDLGVNVGEQGTLARYVERSKLAKLWLEPLTPLLKRLQYTGYVDVNGAVQACCGGKTWPFELTVRLGWPITHNQVALHQGDPVQWMKDGLEGRDTLNAQINLCSVSVVISIPDYPYGRFTQKEVCGIPIYGGIDRDRHHLCEVQLAEQVPTQVGDRLTHIPGLVSAGDYIAVAVGVGSTITAARQSAYAAVRALRMPNNPQYRLDIGRARLVDQLKDLQDHGFATGLSY